MLFVNIMINVLSDAPSECVDFLNAGMLTFICLSQGRQGEQGETLYVIHKGKPPEAYNQKKNSILEEESKSCFCFYVFCWIFLFLHKHNQARAR